MNPPGQPFLPGSFSSDGRLGHGCLFLFALPFFLVGCVISFAGIQKLSGGISRDAIIFCVVGGIFTLVGAGLGIGAIVGFRKARKQTSLRKSAPAEPWKWNPEWASGQIRSAGGKEVFFVWCFALFWNAVCVPLLIMLPQELAKGKKEILIGLVFPVVGIGLLAWAIYATIQRRKYGISVFKMLSVPGVLGGTLRGAVEIPVHVTPKDGFHVRLVCFKRVTTGSGKNSSTSEYVQWEDNKTIVRDLLEHDRSRTGIPVFFNIPHDLPEPKSGNPSIHWRLEVSAETPGVDYSANFEVPVFRTAESNPEATPAEDPTKSYQPDPADYTPPETRAVRFRETVHGEVEIYFPPATSWTGIVFSGLFFAVWTGAIWLMISKKAPIFFPIIFGFFDVIIALIFLASLFYSVRTQAGQGGLRIYHRLLFPTVTRRIAPEDVRRISTEATSHTNAKATSYALTVHTKDGEKYSAGSYIRDKRHADWLAAKLSKALGITGK